MIRIITTIEHPHKKFSNKNEIKNYFIDNFVPLDKDPLRKYHKTLMDRYGDNFFYLIFKKPNICILNHIYLSEEEYHFSIDLRNNQKKLFESRGVFYNISEPIYFDDKLLTKEQYEKLHSDNLIPLDLKFDVDTFLLEIEQYSDKFKRWGDKYKEYPRYGIPLVNLNGSLDNELEPACFPLDRYNFINSGLEDTPQNFTEYIDNFSHFEPNNNALLEYDFRVFTELMNLKSLQFLEPIKKYMYRSCILKWHTLGHLLPHFDTWHPTKWLRLWGTTNPEKMKLRYKKKGVKGVVENKLTGNFEKYVEWKNIEPGRLYLHDSLQWHDAFAFDDDVYQFFIALDVDSYEILEGLKYEI